MFWYSLNTALLIRNALFQIHNGSQLAKDGEVLTHRKIFRMERNTGTMLYADHLQVNTHEASGC